MKGVPRKNMEHRTVFSNERGTFLSKPHRTFLRNELGIVLSNEHWSFLEK